MRLMSMEIKTSPTDEASENKHQSAASGVDVAGCFVQAQSRKPAFILPVKIGAFQRDDWQLELKVGGAGELLCGAAVMSR